MNYSLARIGAAMRADYSRTGGSGKWFIFLGDEVMMSEVWVKASGDARRGGNFYVIHRVAAEAVCSAADLAT
jgi:hypothetical protein